MKPTIQELLMALVSDIDRIRRTEPEQYQKFINQCRSSYEAKITAWEQNNHLAEVDQWMKEHHTVPKEENNL